MIADLKPYPAMKGSGLPWCPQIPSHWELNPNRMFLRQRKVLVGERHSDYTLLSLTKQGVIVRDLTNNKGKFSSDMGTSQEVRCGDLVMCLFDVPETPRTVGLSQHDGMITGAYTVFDVRDASAGKWLEKFYISMDDRKVLSPLYSGLRNTIPKPRFLATKTPIPPPTEHVAIEKYLDYVGRRVRQLVRAKRKLITLLTEQKQAIINRVVTRGINPDVPMKDSGVEWLGKVPEHWEVLPNRAMFNEIKDRDYPDEQMLSVTISRGVIQQATLLKNSWKKDQSNLDRSKYKLVQPGDIAYNKMRAWQGAFGSSSYRGIISPAYIVQRPRPGCSARYFHYLFRTPGFAKEAERWSYGIDSDMWSLRSEHFRLIYACFPPPAEQAAIFEYLDQATIDIDIAIARAQREIELFSEYRTRLIADIVTGKLDVREAAAKLPDKLKDDDDEVELIDEPEESDENLEELTEEIEV